MPTGENLTLLKLAIVWVALLSLGAAGYELCAFCPSDHGE
jgi:hypothetical protein